VISKYLGDGVGNGIGAGEKAGLFLFLLYSSVNEEPARRGDSIRVTS
jgi:hypothetical protein